MPTLPGGVKTLTTAKAEVITGQGFPSVVTVQPGPKNSPEILSRSPPAAESEGEESTAGVFQRAIMNSAIKSHYIAEDAQRPITDLLLLSS